MTKHRDWTIEPSEYWTGYEAVHDAYDPTPIYTNDTFYDTNYPIIEGKDIQDCIEQIDDWYEENEDD